jgi:hypothetical protein
MGLDPITLPQHMVDKIDPRDRPKGDKRFETTAETIQKFIRGEELREQRIYLAWLQFRQLTFDYSRSDRKTTGILGVPDFRVWHGPYYLLLEFKAKDGRVSEVQEEWHDQARKNGITVYIVHTAAVAIEMTKRAFKL